MKIGIMVALQKEWEFFGNCLQNFSAQTIGGCRFGCGSWKNHKITAVVSGMGKVNAAICATRLICDFKPDIIINIGISGGLDNSLDIGDFVVGDDIVYHDVWCGKPNMMGQVQDFPLFYHSDTTLAAKLKDLRHGLLCCGDQFISEADELQKIKHIFPTALAVDMESAAIAQTCYIHKLPFLCVRQISDTPGIKHHQEQYESFWQNAPERTLKILQEILRIL